MTREDLYARIRELVLDAERARPRDTSTLDAATESLAWTVAVDRLLDAADVIRPRQRDVYVKVA